MAVARGVRRQGPRRPAGGNPPAAWKRQGPQLQEASRALVARAASLIEPDPKLEADAPELISAMLAAGYDQAAARWIPAVRGMKNDPADRCLGDARAVQREPARARPQLLAHHRLHRPRQEPGESAQRPARRGAWRAGPDQCRRGQFAQPPLRPRSRPSHELDADDRPAAALGQPGTVLALSGTGLQTPSWANVRRAHLYHRSRALERTGQDFTARMIAAEALSRT